MGIADYFKPVRSMTAEEARAFMKDKNPDDYNLIDVRQPKEYERGHLAGAAYKSGAAGDSHRRAGSGASPPLRLLSIRHHWQPATQV